MQQRRVWAIFETLLAEETWHTCSAYLRSVLVYGSKHNINCLTLGDGTSQTAHRAFCILGYKASDVLRTTKYIAVTPAHISHKVQSRQSSHRFSIE